MITIYLFILASLIIFCFVFLTEECSRFLCLVSQEYICVQVVYFSQEKSKELMMNALYTASSGLMFNSMITLIVLLNQRTVRYFDHGICFQKLIRPTC